MLYINEDKIKSILESAKKASFTEVNRILEKSKELKRLSLEETATLLSVEDPKILKDIYKSAAFVKNEIYGKRVVLFAPLYISNICKNNCVYCAFRADNKTLERKALTPEEITKQTELLLKSGHKRVLVVAGEAPPKGKGLVEYYVEAIKAVYAARYKGHKIKRVNINCAPLTMEEFKQLKAAEIGTFQIFQETYHEETYRKDHPSGPKSDPDNRIDGVNRAMNAGIDDIGIGVLYGLYDYKWETLAMLMHVEKMEEMFGVGPHTISVPRIEPADGSEFSTNVPNKISDEEFKKIVSVLRLSVPYTGVVLSTREKADLRDELVNLGVSQISAASRTNPGGYDEEENKAGGQFEISDERSLDDVLSMLIDKGNIPSFCAACYRKQRTGEAFMGFAKLGTIKGKCRMNALITLKEYLDDFASEDVKKKGYVLIQKEKAMLDDESAVLLSKFYEDIDKGLRDEYV